MLCNAKLRNKAAYCQRHALQGKTRCSLHGGASLSGNNHPNWKHGLCTKESRQRSVETTARIRFLEMVAIELGMMPKKR